MIDASALGTAVRAFVIICTVAVCVAGEIIGIALRNRKRSLSRLCLALLLGTSPGPPCTSPATHFCPIY